MRVFRQTSGGSGGGRPWPVIGSAIGSGWRRRARSAILLRQDTRHGDLKRLATLLRQLAGPDGIKALRTELGRRRQ